MGRTGYQYGTSAKKIEPEYNATKKVNYKQPKKEITNNIQRQDVKLTTEQKKKNTKNAVTVLVIFIVLCTISYRNSLINENFKEIQELKEKLALTKKENEQLEVSIENGLNLNNLEQEAKEKLGMQKLTNKQTEYINLPKKDYVEATAEEIIIEEEKSLITKIIDFIF